EVARVRIDAGPVILERHRTAAGEVRSARFRLNDELVGHHDLPRERRGYDVNRRAIHGLDLRSGQHDRNLLQQAGVHVGRRHQTNGADVQAYPDGRVAGQTTRRVDSARLNQVGDADLAVAGSRGRRCGRSRRGHEVDVVPVNLVAGIERAGILREVVNTPRDDLQRGA